MESNMSWMKYAVKAMMVVGTISAISVWAQPTPAPTTGDLPCKDEVDIVPTDTVNSGGGVDADGYFPMFDGTFKGWFQSCKTGHSNGSTVGAIFRLGTADGKPAIYSTQRGTNTGGLMMTNKTFTNYEIQLETWPDYGNDAGLFNRTPITGRCFQTVLDYIGSAAVGGTWGEGGFPSRDFRPYAFAGDEKTISIPGLPGGNELNNWTTITSKLNPTSFGCPASGCTQTEWRNLWDMDGWNDIKVQFYGGSAAGTGNVHMKFWFKKMASTTWVPVIQDTTFNQTTVPPGFIGLQVHGGGRFGGAKGTWYRNIRWKPLDDKGNVIPQKPLVPTAVSAVDRVKFHFSASASVLTGNIDQNYTITVKDAKGKNLESFSGTPGKVNHAFATNVRGILFLSIKTARSVESFSVVRASN
ncbi:MAG: hypothetical protein JWO30_3023 [Fibrobacteres bacterium]|nr:hypothetical protein [Fibrobacterota bacterium]